MPRKDKIIDKMQGAYWFSCMDFLSGFYQFRVRESNVPFTAFQAPDGAYEYLVLPMGLSNAPATFNAGVRRMLTDLSDICESYFDDIYVYTKSQSIDKHLEALDRVLTRLEEKHYFVKLSKCVFCVDEIPCLGDYVGRNGARIDPAKVKILRDWPLPRTRNELQSFLEILQRFCNDFASDAAPLFDLLKGKGKQKLEWSSQLQNHFSCLKAKISSTPVLAIPNFDRPFHLRMDASDFAVGRVIFQEEGEGIETIERPVAFGGRKYKSAEKNYSIREKELLAILFGLRLWCVYLLDKPCIVETDHRSLETLFSQKTISRPVARWYDELCEYLIKFRYIPGKDNEVADGISRRPDFKDGVPATYNLVNGKIFYETRSYEHPRLVLPHIREIIDGVLYEFHDTRCYGHPGIERTLRLVEKEYYWRRMERSVRSYVRSCEVCQRTKGRSTKPPGVLRLHQIPTARWTHLAMDFIVALPESQEGFDSIMVVVDRLTKPLETAKLCRDRVFVLHGLPREILSDRDSKFTSAVWTNFCEMLGTQQKLTTAFRQQANSVTERINQTIENYLRVFTNSNSDDWDQLLSLAEFAYNARYQASINMSPFEADLRYQPATPASLKPLQPSKSPTARAVQKLGEEFVEHQKDVIAKA
ncbi:Retrovirus Polyprotein [Phytophthora palmivora]|uniref:Retrovirus Polyprotein n=1 Tax=Phytophthora palmivora TaxID=4796 RepID=A0A2P4Y5R7_9STRA|nr:Retrovirus Polyprotein [Phytophthora palmivora]